MHNFSIAQEDPIWMVPCKQFQVIYHDMIYYRQIYWSRTHLFVIHNLFFFNNLKKKKKVNTAQICKYYETRACGTFELAHDLGASK